MVGQEDDLVDLRWIADTAVVGASTVSNWRRRDPRFPARAGGTDGRPLFNKSEVIAWGRATGRFGPNREIGVVTSREHARAILGVMRAHVPPRFFHAASVLVFAHLKGITLPSWSFPLRADADVMGSFSMVEGLSDATVGILADGIEPIVGGRDCADIFEELIDQLAGKDFPQLSSMALARAMTALIPQPPQVVFDPAAGIGTLLLRAQEQLKPQEIIAGDLEADALLVLWMRFQLRGWPVTISRRDALDDALSASSETVADLVLLDPPFGALQDRVKPASSSSAHGLRLSPEQLWVRAATAHLTADGTAIVHMLAGSGSDAAGAEGRTDLITSGSLQTVIALPPGMVSGADRRVLSELWVLGPEASTPSPTVRMIDASNVPTDELPAELTAISSAGHDLSAGGISVADVDRFELLRNGAVLTPRRWIATRYSVDDAQADLSRIHQTISSLQDDLAPLGQAAMHTQLATNPVRTATLRSLLDTRRIQRLRSRPSSVIRNTSDLLEARVLTGKVLRGLEEPSIELVDPRSMLEPGDIVHSEIGKPVVEVWRETGWALGSAVTAWRILEPELIPEYIRVVLTSAIAEAIGFRGNTAVHFEPQLVPIPMRPLSDQHAIVNDMSRLELAIKTVSQAAQNLDQARAAFANVAAAGLLRYQADPKAPLPEAAFGRPRTAVVDGDR